MSEQEDSKLGFSPNFDAMPSPDATDHSRALQEWLAGSYQSSWSDLRFAAYSGALCALVGAQRVRDGIPGFIAKARSQGEATFVLSFNHRISVLGPALGTVTTAAFALESFLRLGYVVAVELVAERSRTQRAGGFDALLKKRLLAFDNLAASQRLEALLTVTRARKRGAPRRQVVDLFQFRNEVAHDSPILHTRHLGAQKPPRNGRELRARQRIGPYELLKSTERAVRLCHVLFAIHAHDDFVQHVFGTARLKGWAAAVRAATIISGDRIQDIAPNSDWYTALVSTADHWESEIEPRFPEDLRQILTLRDEMARRVRIKRLK